MSEKDEVEKMVDGIKSLATPLQDLIMFEAMKDRDYANKAAAELAALRARVEALEKAGKTVLDTYKLSEGNEFLGYDWVFEKLEAALK